jgi:mono/diheme cytochrome c family protein
VPSTRSATIVIILLAVMIPAAIHVTAQPPGPAPQTPPPGGRGGGGQIAIGSPRTAYPTRPTADPAVLERGKALYGIHCVFCHGAEARGGDGGGPNLLRSEMVLRDQNGELIAPIVQKGTPDGMPPFDLTPAQISDIATFIHSFKVGGYDISRVTPPSILVGDATAGEATFKAKCGSCHSITGDLKGFGAKFSDPKQLQQTWLMPGGGRGGGRGAAPLLNVPPTTVTVTPASGQKVEGRLNRIDDFVVSLTEADGTVRSFRRDGGSPKVEVHDPVQPHKDLLTTYRDKEIHDITAYLVTVK